MPKPKVKLWSKEAEERHVARLKEAVVEAAKAWNKGWDSRPGKHFADADALYSAVRELEAAEKGKKI